LEQKVNNVLVWILCSVFIFDHGPWQC